MRNWLLSAIKLSARNSQSELQIRKIVPLMIPKIQSLYDSWDQSGEFGDAELGFGGICQDVADIIADVLISNGIQAGTVSAQVGEQHVYVIAKTDDGVYEVDIPPSVYETGGGYNWRKIEGVVFSPNDFVVSCLSANPNDFEQFFE